MTNREKFLKVAELDVRVLRAMSDEMFVEWVTCGGFHWSGTFQRFAWDNGYLNDMLFKDKNALRSWLSEEADCGETLKECKNCGMPPVLRHDAKKGWWVECDGCDSTTGYQYTRYKAVEKWNKVN